MSLVALFPDEVDLGRIADGINAEAFLGLGSDQRASLLSCEGAGLGSGCDSG